MINKIDIVGMLLFFTLILGGFIGYKFGQNEQLEFYKLLNLFGLIYDFIAVLLLSYAVFAKYEIQDAVVQYVSVFFIWFSTAFPVGFSVTDKLAGGGELDFYMYVFVYISLVPMLYVYCSPVLEQSPHKSYEPNTRIKILGTILLLVGFAFQIIAALEGLSS